MVQLTLYNSTTHENIIINVPESIANDLENTIIINGFETFNLVNTIPENIKALRDYEQEFEEKEFDTLYDSWFFKPASFNDIASNFEKSFNEYFTGCIKEKYPNLDKLSDKQKESILITLRTRFMVYMFNKQYENEHKEDKIEEVSCFGEDYAHRIIKLFKELSLDDAESILNFSTNLEKTEQSMLNDTRRRAGFDAMMLGLSTAIQDIASVFINDPNAENINLIEAFKNSSNSKDKDTVKSKLEKVIDNSVDYYQKYLQNLKNSISVINKVDSNKSIAYLKVAHKLISCFVSDTRSIVAELSNLKENTHVDDLIKNKTENYKKVVNSFNYSLDLLMTAFDHEKVKEDEYGKKVVSAWKLYEKEKSSDSNTWYVTLANDYVAAWEDLFGCLKSL